MNLKSSTSNLQNEIDNQFLKQELRYETSVWNDSLSQNNIAFIKKDIKSWLLKSQKIHLPKYKLYKKLILDLQKALEIEEVDGKTGLSIFLKIDKIRNNANLMDTDETRYLENIDEELNNNRFNSRMLFYASCSFAILLLVLIVFAFKEKENYKKLAYRQELYLNNSIDCIMISDNDNRIVEFNKAAENTFGYTKEEVLMKDSVLIHASIDDSKKIAEQMQKYGKYIGEVRNRDRFGRQFISFLSANTITDKSGKVIGAMGISRDITQQKKTEDIYYRIIDNAPDFIFTTDINGVFTYVNNSSYEISGYEKEELIGQSYLILSTTSERRMIQDFYEDKFVEKQKESYREMKLQRKDGSTIWVSQNVQLLTDPVDPNYFIGFNCIMRNIDDAKKNELRLEESEKRYSDMFTNSKDLIHSIDFTGKLLFANDSWKNVLQYDSSEIEKLNIFDIVDTDSLDFISKLLRNISDGKDYQQNNIEISIIGKDKKPLKLNCSISISKNKGNTESIHFFMNPINNS